MSSSSPGAKRGRGTSAGSYSEAYGSGGANGWWGSTNETVRKNGSGGFPSRNAMPSFAAQVEKFASAGASGTQTCSSSLYVSRRRSCA